MAIATFFQGNLGNRILVAAHSLDNNFPTLSPGRRTAHHDVSAGIYECSWDAVVLDHSESFGRDESFGDPTQIQLHALLLKLHRPTPGLENDLSIT